MEFLANYGLFILLALLLVFMFWNSRKRMKRQKEEQAAKAQQTVPGAEVLLQGGLYGTIVSYDADDLDKPAEVELAPGMVIKVHSQAILRIVNPVEGFVTEDDFIQAEADEAEYIADVADGDISSLGDDHRATAEAEAEAEKKNKPEA